MLNDDYTNNCIPLIYQVILNYLVTSNNFKHINQYLRLYCFELVIKTVPCISLLMSECWYMYINIHG